MQLAARRDRSPAKSCLIRSSSGRFPAGAPLTGRDRGGGLPQARPSLPSKNHGLTKEVAPMSLKQAAETLPDYAKDISAQSRLNSFRPATDAGKTLSSRSFSPMRPRDRIQATRRGCRSRNEQKAFRRSVERCSGSGSSDGHEQCLSAIGSSTPSSKTLNMARCPRA